LSQKIKQPASIIFEETSGLDRINEPVTFGVPLPEGLVSDVSQLTLVNGNLDYLLPLHSQVLAKWYDGSVKWVLLDTQLTVKSKEKKQISLRLGNTKSIYQSKKIPPILFEENQDSVKVDTQVSIFIIDKKIFKPFCQVTVKGKECLDEKNCQLKLIDDQGLKYDPVITHMEWMDKGPLRAVFKIGGVFNNPNKKYFANFVSRISFFAGRSFVKLELAIHNPKAATHRGGLWDLGDPGSVYFRSLSLHLMLNSNSGETEISCRINEDPVPMVNNRDFNRHGIPDGDPINLDLHRDSRFLIYQDSSGGKNWSSLNHVNRNGEIKNSFRGYRIYQGEEVVRDGLRSNPVLSIKKGGIQINTAVKWFWENFPKAIEAKTKGLVISLYPGNYADIFELQGGEQKTHTIFLEFGEETQEMKDLSWVQDPLFPVINSEWITSTGVIGYFVAENEDPNKEYTRFVDQIIKSNHSFFHRREIIDEYGWRNFGDIYADHEAVGSTEDNLLISHYNNQYDCLYGFLIHYLRSGDLRWFILADQLASHVKDIDIYHTEKDRLEYNYGLFWHTSHYLDVGLASHRTYSKAQLIHLKNKNYGGGPSLSHNYTSGLMLHYYLTGDNSSKQAVNELIQFVTTNIEYIESRRIRAFEKIKKLIILTKNLIFRVHHDGAQNQIYLLDGPGRASGNSLNALLDGFCLYGENEYLQKAESLIRKCIAPDDDIIKRDLWDIETRWMYTIFLQALGKYLDIKNEEGQKDPMWHYAKNSLIHYAKWMADNEKPYLHTPEKLEYPNETWAAQEIRKCNVFFYAAKNCDDESRQIFLKKAKYFYSEVSQQFFRNESAALTRPLILLLVNGLMASSFNINPLQSFDLK
jgi:hypothetical protein